MGKQGSLLLFLVITFSVTHSQEVVFKIAKSYFRSDPFRGEFSSFLKHLLDDPTLTDKTVEKRTDTSLFYFKGTYKPESHNPFFFKPRRIQVALAEAAVDLDSTLKDTIFIYELLVFCDDTKKGNEEIRKEYEKLLKRYKGSFSKNEYKDNPPELNLKGGIYNFFDRNHAISPFALALYGPYGNNEMCMVLSIRLDTYANQAMLASPYIFETDVPAEDR